MNPDFSCTARRRLRISSGKSVIRGTGKREIFGCVMTGFPLKFRPPRIKSIASDAHSRKARCGDGGNDHRALRAFSSEVDTGSREENASKQESRASVLIQSERNML